MNVCALNYYLRPAYESLVTGVPVAQNPSRCNAVQVDDRLQTACPATESKLESRNSSQLKFCCFLQGSVSLSITLRHVSHAVLTRAVVSACPGHASPTEAPGRVCCHSTPPKDLIGPVRPRGLGFATKGWASGISPFALALVSLSAVAQQQPVGL